MLLRRHLQRRLERILQRVGSEIYYIVLFLQIPKPKVFNETGTKKNAGLHYRCVPFSKVFLFQTDSSKEQSI